MLRRLTLAIALSLALPASAGALPGQTSIFYYPWYSTPQVDGFHKHWDRGGHIPPIDLASSFYPVRGPYSSSDPGVLQAQMREIAAAGVGEVISSWWGVGSLEDQRLPSVIEAAKAQGLRVATQLEPYDQGRTPTSVAADIARLRDLGIARIYVYRPFDIDPVTWRELSSEASGVQFFAQTANVRWAAAAGFAGVYTYDILTYPGSTFRRLCARAHAAQLLCAPSVGPGYDALRANGDTRIRHRRDGATYDSMWGAAVEARADVVTITSYNEWHEGTQIEPARTARSRVPAITPIRPSYGSYNGAYGLTGKPAETAYLVRTAFWTRMYRIASGAIRALHAFSRTENAGRDPGSHGEGGRRERSRWTPLGSPRPPGAGLGRCQRLELAFFRPAI